MGLSENYTRLIPSDQWLDFPSNVGGVSSVSGLS